MVSGERALGIRVEAPRNAATFSRAEDQVTNIGDHVFPDFVDNIEKSRVVFSVHLGEGRTSCETLGVRDANLDLAVGCTIEATNLPRYEIQYAYILRERN